MQKIVRIEVVECVGYWCLSSLDNKGIRHQYNDLVVWITDYDVREKRLALAKERAAILAYEENLTEYFIVRLSNQRERIKLEYSMVVFAEHLQLKETDQAEMVLAGKLIRFAGWNGLRFERYRIVCSEAYSLDHSPIYRRLFSSGQAVFYRLKSTC